MRIEQSDVQSALTNDEFEIYYQPLISLESGEICACEALLRWNHPKRGKLLPAEFVPALEFGRFYRRCRRLGPSPGLC